MATIFKDIINEVLSIANIVDKKSDAIKKAILDNANTIEWHNDNYEPMIKYKTNSFETDLLADLNPNIKHISYNYVYFPDEQMYRKYHDTLLDKGSYVNNNIFSIEFASINGNILVSEFEGSIYHELEHLYQIKKAQENYILKNGRYRLALRFLNDEDSDLSILANFIYLTSKPELDANINGLYAYIKKYKPETILKFMNSPVVCNEKYYIDFYYKQVTELNDNSASFKVFQVDKNWCMNRYKKTTDYLINKLGKIYTRYLTFEAKFNPYFRKPLPKYLI